MMYPRWFVRFMNYYTGFEIPITIWIPVNAYNKKEAKQKVKEEILPIIQRKLRDTEIIYRIKVE